MPGKILILDDDPDSVRLLTLMLTPEGYEVISARNGQEGLKRVAQERPALILLDIMMPDMDGFEVCRRLRQTAATAHVPVVMLSARSRVDDKIEGLRAGASDYLTKPVHRKDLLGRVEALLRMQTEQGARTIAVMGVKRGSGATTVAVNLAIALSAASGKKVILVDTQLPFGDLDLLLNLPMGRNWADLIPYLDELDGEVLSTVLTSHASGIQVLLGPNPRAEAPVVPDGAFSKIIGHLRGMADFIIMDTAPPDWPSSASLLQIADIVVLVLTPDLPTLSLTPMAMEAARAARTPPPEVHPVLNHAGSGLPAATIEAQLMQKMAALIPEEEGLVTVAANRGVPVTMSHPNSGVAREIRNLARLLSPAIVETKSAKSGRLGGLRKGN